MCPFRTKAEVHWGTVRECWLELQGPDAVQVEAQHECLALQRLHDAALDELVAAGQLDPRVGAALHQAFEEAIDHVAMRNALCYAVMRFEAAPRRDMVQQTAALSKMAGRSKIEPKTVARAREALEQDMARLAQLKAGKPPGQLKEIRATPAEVEAASVLVKLLVKRG